MAAIPRNAGDHTQGGRDVHHRVRRGWGQYVIAAVTGMSMAKLFEASARAEIAERIAKGGERIVLVENDKHSIDVRITKLQ